MAGTALAALAVTGAAAAAGHGSNAWPYTHSRADHGRHTYTLAAVGDIACEPDIPENATNPGSLKCGSKGLGEYATAGQAIGMEPDAVAVLGDEQYEVGKLVDFENSYEKVWGGLKMLSRPAPGNHEFYAYTKHGDDEAGQNGAGYFGYFNGHDEAGTPYPHGQAGSDTSDEQGWYSYDLGHWHVISLNVECKSDAFGHDCSTTDDGLLAQETRWLAADLKAEDRPCTIAYWHQPTFSATTTKEDAPDPTTPGVDSTEGTAADAWWKLLYRAHATLVLNGHEHVYARFRPQDPNGNPDPRHGITQFTVGTGGEDLDTVATDAGSYSNANVATGYDQGYGVLKLSLKPNGYAWDYRPALPGADAGPSAISYADTGTGTCRG